MAYDSYSAANVGPNFAARFMAGMSPPYPRAGWLALIRRRQAASAAPSPGLMPLAGR